MWRRDHSQLPIPIFDGWGQNSYDFSFAYVFVYEKILFVIDETRKGRFYFILN